MKFKKIVSNKKDWIGYISRKEYNELKKSKWKRFKWIINPMNPMKLKVWRKNGRHECK